VICIGSHMIYQKLWDDTRIREVLTTESRQKARDLFLQTHRPFQRIRLDFSKEDGSAGVFIDEDNLLTSVQSGPLRAHNRLFLIVGEAGSGKSELCQWIEYSADLAQRLPIHIPRSMTSAAHVVGLLREKIAQATARPALRRAPLTDQADYIALSAVVLLYEHDSRWLIPTDQWAELLRSAALRRIILDHLVSASEGQRTHRLLSEDADVAKLCAKFRISLEEDRVALAAQELRRLLGRAIEQTLWLGDVRALLAELSRQAVAQGRRPLLLLEDVTAFQLLGDRLLDYLLDLTSGHFDAVIGATTGYERTRLASVAHMEDLTHVHHRLTARCVLTDDHGRAYGFEDDLIEFTRGYLRAVRGGHTSPDSAPFGGDLYPFTEIALRRALACLHEEGSPRQTPRLFLEHVIGAALLADDIPPVTLDRSAYLQPPPLLFRSDDISDVRLQSTLRWYGDIGEQHVTLESQIAEALGMLATEQSGGGQLRVERAYVPQMPSHRPVQSDWQVELRELQAWLSGGGIYPSRETLKRGIERAMLSLGDPRSLASPHALSLTKAEIVYARGDERLPIVLGKESGDQPGTEAYIKVQVQGSSEERGILEELAYLEMSGAGLSEVCQNVAITLDWVQQHWDAYNSQIRAMLTRRLSGLSPEDLIWAAWRLICALEGTMWSEIPSVQIRGDSAAPYHQVSPWSVDRHATCYSAGETLLQWHEPARRLFSGMFMLRDTLLDRARVMQMTRVTQGDATVHKIAQIQLKALQTLPFKIRPSGQSLYALLAPLQRYALALTQIDISTALQRDIDDLRQRESYLTQQEALDTGLLQSQLIELRRRCGEVGVTWRESWDEALAMMASVSTSDLTALLVQARSLRTLAEEYADTRGCDIWDYQALRHALRPLHQHPYWSALAALRVIQHALLRTARGRYRRDGRMLTGTHTYRSLLQEARMIWKEVESADTASDG
jgi:hypothetical protein